MTQSVELARQEGEEFRTVRLAVSDDVAFLRTVDAGPTAEFVWGHDEYQFSVNVKASDFPKLVFGLLRERFAGKLDAVDQFREFCERSGVPYDFDTWP